LSAAETLLRAGFVRGVFALKMAPNRQLADAKTFLSLWRSGPILPGIKTFTGPPQATALTDSQLYHSRCIPFVLPLPATFSLLLSLWPMTKTVFIVDDSTILRNVIKEYLRASAGLEQFRDACNGREAIEQVMLQKPDLIILDLAMPVMDGLQAARALKSLAPEIPILLFTMHSARAEDLGVDAVISKVDGIGQLAQSVQSLLA